VKPFFRDERQIHKDDSRGLVFEPQGLFLFLEGRPYSAQGKRTDLVPNWHKVATWGKYTFSSKGGRPKKWTNLDQNDPSFWTWEKYCDAIGIKKATANRWIASVYFFP